MEAREGNGGSYTSSQTSDCAAVTLGSSVDEVATMVLAPHNSLIPHVTAWSPAHHGISE